ncbi:MAG TPA: DedA family protein [Candidatus Omnitrophota bacterium]|nr:DedA family protein [Candidatus Omnitrophota bacterium]HPD84298.1 DedA family protein [Candidatus Omnitrophota bacterium]HRZ03155.1 DedA family protein [Candidatus Omnitrophota bacterium]
MEFIKEIVGIFLHVDKYLDLVIQNFGVWSYLLLFVIVFAETGLVVTPFLPGDSLLFAVGAFAAKGSFSLFWAFVTLAAAGIIGDSVNYAVGKFFGMKLFQNENSRIFKKEYLDRTHRFYEKHGGKTIILARFIPIVRTFAPFVAGIGKMNYLHFLIYNVSGALLWVTILVVGGFYFGNMPYVEKNFSLVIFAIIIISILPGVIEFLRHRRNSRRLAAGIVTGRES